MKGAVKIEFRNCTPQRSTKIRTLFSKSLFYFIFQNWLLFVFPSLSQIHRKRKIQIWQSIPYIPFPNSLSNSANFTICMLLLSALSSRCHKVVKSIIITMWIWRGDSLFNFFSKDGYPCRSYSLYLFMAPVNLLKNGTTKKEILITSNIDLTEQKIRYYPEAKSVIPLPDHLPLLHKFWPKGHYAGHQ